MKFLKVCVPRSATRRMYRSVAGRGVGVGESPWNPSPPPVAGLTLLDELRGRVLAAAAVVALPPVDDDRDVRVVLVVVDHLVVELVGELAWNHAIDHVIPMIRRQSEWAQ